MKKHNRSDNKVFCSHVDKCQRRDPQMCEHSRPHVKNNGPKCHCGIMHCDHAGSFGAEVHCH